PAAAAHWRLVDPLADDPGLPEGVAPLSREVDAPAVLRRRLAQTGLVARADGERLQAALKPGQRLVSREGDLWRWDGYVAAADSPKPAAQRLASRNRLAELELDGEAARSVLRGRREDLEAATADMRSAEEVERAARD